MLASITHRTAQGQNFALQPSTVHRLPVQQYLQPHFDSSQIRCGNARDRQLQYGGQQFGMLWRSQTVTRSAGLLTKTGASTMGAADRAYGKPAPGHVLDIWRSAEVGYSAPPTGSRKQDAASGNGVLGINVVW